jgi:hypothetical protein
MFRGLAKPLAEGSDEKLVHERGLPLSYTEPQLVLDPRGGISHVASANPLTPPVARSLTEFLEHWLEAGCFTSHHLGAYFPKIQHLVPSRIPPEKNLWIAHWARDSLSRKIGSTTRGRGARIKRWRSSGLGASAANSAPG